MAWLTSSARFLLTWPVIQNGFPILILSAHDNSHHGFRIYPALEGIDDLRPRDGHNLAVERFKIVEWQIVEADHIQIIENIGIAGDPQGKTTGNILLRVNQFLFRGALLDIVLQRFTTSRPAA